MSGDIQILKDILAEKEGRLAEDEINKIADYYKLVLEDNEKQNLTRLTDPMDFYEGHVYDVIELEECDFCQEPALDLGSGCGVPGLLSALIFPRSWVLADSEMRKAAFLAKAIKELGIENVSAYPGRAEDFLKDSTVETVVARAIAKVGKIYKLIRDCSTWNRLVLFKGPSWDSEWKDFQKKSPYKDELVIKNTHEYSVGDSEKKLKIIHLERA